MNELALFAGAGGGLLASRWLLGWQTVCYVENNKYCTEVIKARIRDGMLDDAPIWDDAKTFDGKPWCGCVDIVTAGFPCQPWSTAGKQKGTQDERNLWPATIRIIREVGPQFCLLENVPGLLAHQYYGTILGELAESGFDVRWKVVSAAEVGAPHKRDRLWIVAHAECVRCSSTNKPESGSNREATSQTTLRRAKARNGVETQHHRESSEGYSVRDVSDALRAVGESRAGGRRIREGDTDVADTSSIRCHGDHWEPGEPQEKRRVFKPKRPSWWATEPNVGRVADGVAHRVDRLKALGNGQVPAVVATAWDILARSN